ncbi:T-cell receptor beta-1 chain C region [Diretmus argenteus]
MAKHEKPHGLYLICNEHSLVEQSCSCTAGSDDIYSKSQPQQWHKARAKKITGQPVSSVVVAKANVNRKRKPIMSSYIHNHVSVVWEVDGVPATRGVATDSAALREGEVYSITSRLRVRARMWHTPNKNFTCIVSLYNGTATSSHSDSALGVEGEGMTREKYLKITQTAKFSYGVFMAKSSLYGVFVLVLVWKLQVDYL